MVLMAGGGYLFYSVSDPLKAIEPQELFQKALTRTKAAKSYSYRLRSCLVTPQGTRCLSDLNGRRILPDKVCVKGKVFNAPVEIIQVGGTTYIKDCFSPKWLIFEGDRLGGTGVFLTELDPLVLLDFAEVPVVDRKEKGRGKNKDLYLLAFKPRVKNRFLAAQFTDFAYRLSVEPKEYYIRQVEVQARSKKAPTKLLLNLDLGDFDRVQGIEPPADVSPQ
uniref:Outer membrane lipoprotein carrier protein LolA n=1 Tax=Ammonifex degensii TaxID=42838 RepID=A0A7C1J810_9THEO